MKGMEGKPKPDRVKVIATGGVVAIIKSLKPPCDGCDQGARALYHD